MSTKRISDKDLEDTKENVVAVVNAAVTALLAHVSRRLDEQEQLATSLGMAKVHIRALSVQITMELSAQLAAMGFEKAEQIGAKDFAPKLFDGLSKVFGGQFELSYKRKGE